MDIFGVLQQLLASLRSVLHSEMVPLQRKENKKSKHWYRIRQNTGNESCSDASILHASASSDHDLHTAGTIDKSVR